MNAKAILLGLSVAVLSLPALPAVATSIRPPKPITDRTERRTVRKPVKQVTDPIRPRVPFEPDRKDAPRHSDKGSGTR